MNWIKKITFIQAGGPHATHLGHDRTKRQSEGWFAHLLLPSHIRAHGSWAFQLYSPGGHWHHWPLDLDWVTPPTLLVFQMVGYRTVLPVFVSQVLQKCLSQSLLKIFLKFPCGPVVRIRHFHCHGLDLVPDQGTKILRAMWHPSCPIFFFLYTHTYVCVYIYLYIYSSYWFLFFWRTLTMQSHHANPSAAHLGGRVASWRHESIESESRGRMEHTHQEAMGRAGHHEGHCGPQTLSPPWVVRSSTSAWPVVSVIPNIVLAAALSDVLLFVLFCWLHTNIGAVHRSCNSGATRSWECVDGLQTVRSSSETRIRIMWSVNCRSYMLSQAQTGSQVVVGKEACIWSRHFSLPAGNSLRCLKA